MPFMAILQEPELWWGHSQGLWLVVGVGCGVEVEGWSGRRGLGGVEVAR